MIDMIFSSHEIEQAKINLHICLELKKTIENYLSSGKFESNNPSMKFSLGRALCANIDRNLNEDEDFFYTRCVFKFKREFSFASGSGGDFLQPLDFIKHVIALDWISKQDNKELHVVYPVDGKFRYYEDGETKQIFSNPKRLEYLNFMIDHLSYICANGRMKDVSHIGTFLKVTP